MLNKGFSSVVAIILILVIAVAVGAGVYFWQQQEINDLEKQVELFQDKEQESAKQEETVLPTETIKEEKEITTNEAQTDEPQGDVVGDENKGQFNFEYVFIGDMIPSSLMQKEFTQTVADKIGDEFLTGGMGCTDTNNNKIYFATAQAGMLGIEYAKIYSFDKNRDKIVELYWEKYGKEFKIMGLDGNKLVVFRVDSEFLLKNCEEPWDFPQEIKYLDLTNPTAGLHEYTIPQDILDKHDIYKKECTKNLQ